MNLSNGRVWPYAIGLSITLIFGACVATIVVATKLPVEKSDLYMTNYHDADANANKLIQAKIDFDKKYKIEYVSQALNTKNSVVKYKVTDVNSNSIDNAKLSIVITRPNNHKNNQEFSNPSIENGLYTFSNIQLPLEGRWDVMAKVSIGDSERYYNVKADTRDKKITEY